MDQIHLGERLSYGALALMMFGVGVLVGARFCTESTSSVSEDTPPAHADLAPGQCPPPQVVTKQVVGPERIIYECPPPKPPPETKPGKGAKRIKAQKVARKVELPKPTPQVDPLIRKRLLAWAREQSEGLKRCRDDNKEVYRVAIIMHLGAKKEVRRVDVNGDRDIVSGQASGCIRREILTWRPPKDLVKDQTKLVFGLNI